jgi:hypothetical protein
LILQKTPGLTPPQVKRRLRASAIDVERGQSAGARGTTALKARDGPDRATGTGLVNAKAAVDAA